MSISPNRGARAAAPLALLALSLASASASAQSTVKISGYLDIGMYRDSHSGVTQVGNIQRSNLAFSGTEDLGGGLSTFFNLSTRFEMDTGATEAGGRPFWHGESTVGMKGDFGSIKMGRALDAMYSNDWNFDPWYYFDRVASPAWDLWHFLYPSDPKANSGSADYGRLDNGVFYVSPTYAGFTLSASATPERRTGDVGRGKSYSLNYSANGNAAMLSQGKNSANAEDTFVGLKTTVAGVAVMGAWDYSKSGTDRARSVTLGAQYNYEKFTYNLGWGKVDYNGTKYQSMFSGMVGYALSKRTSVYVDLARKNFASYDTTVYGGGISHSF